MVERSVLKSLWDGWKRIAARIAQVQGHILLGLIYMVVVAPLGLMFRIFRQDPLALRPASRSSFWQPRSPLGALSDFLKRQF